ncbi:MAG: DUF167 domain-containing protein [Planctomycetota bacterium]|nr:DUF167 domain-containing protein [Planctomycetota bacterium]
MTLRIEQVGDDVLLWIKAVPGASRDQVTGLVGERLKVRISAPPEGGKANRAICKTLASALGIKPGRISIKSGSTNPEKIVRVEGESIESVRARLEA